MEIDEETLLLAGFTLGAFFMERYRIEALIGAGAMGKVFRAMDLWNEHPVALKVLHPDKATKEQVLARFRREAEILKELGHPGIVRVLDSGRAAEGIEYLIMELLPGRTLRDRVMQQGPASPQELLPILVSVSDALGAAHQKGVVHRDLKPDNILLLEDGSAKVVDFGLSLLDTDTRMTKTGVMLGTPRYMAPEQIRSAKDVDPRVDIYALCVIIHEALTGSSPFPAQDAGQLLGCVIEGRIIPIETQRPDLPVGMGDVIRRGMAKDRGDRYATMGAFIDAFGRTMGVTLNRSRPSTGEFQPFAGMTPPPAGTLPSGDVVIPSGPDKPRFTMPEMISSVPPPPRQKKKKSGLVPVLVIGGFALLFVGLLCLAAAAFYAYRAGYLSAYL